MKSKKHTIDTSNLISQMEPGSYQVLVYLPNCGDIIYMQDGTGDQLDRENMEAGFDSYIDYKINHYLSGEDLFFKEGDGGIFLYRSEGKHDWKKEIVGCLYEIYGEVPEYQILRLPQ